MKPTSRRNIAYSALGSLVIWAGAPTPARAGGFSTARFGGEHGHAATDSVTSIFYNPAGLALGHGTRIYVEGTFAYRTVDYVRAEGTIDNPGTGTPDDAISANAGASHLANVLASPFAGIATDFGVDGLGVALALYAPYGGQASWDKNAAYEGSTDYPGAVDGPQRWGNIEGAQRSVYITLGGAYASPERSVSVGVGLNIISSDISLVRARNATGTDDLVNPDGSVSEGRSLLEVSDLTVGLGIGAMWHPTDKLRLGLSYQSKPGFGDMTLEGDLTNKFGSAPETTIPVVLLQRMPDAIRFGAEIAASDKVTVRIGADWTRWSAYENQCLVDDVSRTPADDSQPQCRFTETGAIDTAGGGGGVVVNLQRDWKDTYGVKAGVGIAATDTIEVSGSLAYDSNAVPDETMDPSLFDMNKIIVQVGADLGLGDKLTVSATLGQVIYFSRTTEPRADADEPEPPSLNPDMAGEYSSAVTYGLLGLGVKI